MLATRRSIRALTFAAALLTLPAAAAAQGDGSIAMPVLRAEVTVTADVVRVGDLVDNAGSAAQIAVYRSPDLGTTGTLPASQVLEVLRGRQVIGVDARNVRQVTVTRLARTLAMKEIETTIAGALDHRFGLGDAANIAVTIDRGGDLLLEASHGGAPQASALRYDQRSGRFDITLEIAGGDAANPSRLRFTGTAIETVEATVLTRDAERNDTLKLSDLALVRRPKAELGGEAVPRDKAVGMQLRRAMRAGAALKLADLARPDFVQRDQGVVVIYRTAGLYLTTRGKALESGSEGDVVNVMNLQSKRTVTGVVTGRGQVTIQVTIQAAIQTGPTAPPPAADTTSSLAPEEPAAAVALAAQVPQSRARTE